MKIRNLCPKNKNHIGSPYHHLSQMDIVPFPGDDPREFWQRAEDRTSATAVHYDQLGMAEYQAMEVFLKLY